MQIAGSICAICNRRVTFAVDGKCCPDCNTAVHLLCEPGAACGSCGRAFVAYERPASDTIGDAVLPRALRTRDAGPGFAVLTIAMVAVMVIIGYFALIYALSHGH